MPARLALLLCTFAIGCGSGAPLPPAAEPATSPPPDAEPAGRVVHARRLPASPPATRLSDGATVRVDRLRRRLVIDADGETHTAPAGLGPTQVVVGANDRIYVTDTDGGAVLLFRRGEQLELVRRAAVPGKPYATAIDRERGKLWVTVTATNEVVKLTADGAPRVQARFPAVRQPNAIAVDSRRGRVYVLGAAGELQAFDRDLDSGAG